MRRQALLLAIAALVVSASALADEPIKRKVLQHGELSGVPGREGVLYQAEIAPGATVAKHTHPGDEFVFVVRGTVTVETEGKPPATVKAGDSDYLPAGIAHTIRNASTSEPALAIGFQVSEPGKPLATAAE